mmetsp:Transcript_14227/g.40438  ORF Transcript_14227/g.40438 Transcript_14227/m.40438 type:complete len:236 (+) Transcript_14227:1751-2458(+)
MCLESQCQSIARASKLSFVDILWMLLLTTASRCSASSRSGPPRPVQQTNTEWKNGLKCRRHAFKQLPKASLGWNWSPPLKPIDVSTRTGARFSISSSGMFSPWIPAACNAAIAIRFSRSTNAMWSFLLAYHFVLDFKPGTTCTAGRMDDIAVTIACVAKGSAKNGYPSSRLPLKQQMSEQVKMYGSWVARKCSSKFARPERREPCASSRCREMSERTDRQCGCKVYGLLRSTRPA